MTDHTLAAIEKVHFTQDRQSFVIELRTDKGPLRLSVTADVLDILISRLQGAEHQASLLDPVKGARAGERGQVSAVRVDSHRTLAGALGNEVSVILGLGSHQVFRWFALQPPMAEAVKRSIEESLARLSPAPKPN